jgi:hypothetical protein
MMRKIYTLLAAITLLASCKDDRPTDCTFPDAPKMDEIHLSVIDFNNDKDLLVPGKFNPDSIVVVQACSPGTPIEVVQGNATRPESGATVRSIRFENLSSFGDWRDCQKLAIWWNKNDMDTIQFVVEEQRCAGNCCMTYYPRIFVDGQMLEPGNGIEGEGGMHFLLMKTIPE